MTSDKKGWKDRLQKSGLALENRVRRELESLRIPYFTDVEYVRKDLFGKSITHSFDFLGYTTLKHISTQDTKQLKFNFAIECEQRHPGIDWYFQPQRIIDSFRDYELILGYKVPDTAESVWVDENEGLLSWKGVEIGDNANEKGIEHAISQVAYGLPYKLIGISNRIYEATLKNLPGYIVFFLLPIVVTNAKLHLLNNDWDERFHESKEPSDIAKLVDYVLVCDVPSSDLAEHKVWVLKEMIEALRNSYGEGSERKIIEDVRYYLGGTWKSWKFCVVVNIDFFVKLITEYMETYRTLFGVLTQQRLYEKDLT